MGREKKDNRVRLRTSSRTIGQDGLKPNLTLILSLTLSLTLKKETKERNLEKGKTKIEPSGFELTKLPKAHVIDAFAKFANAPRAITQPTVLDGNSL